MSSGVAATAGCDSMDGKPFVGMEFHTHTEAYDFYNSYALMCGFGIRKTSSTYSRKEPGELSARTFVCNKEGKKFCSGKERTDNMITTNRRESRLGCGARMRIQLTSSKTWKVTKFVEMYSGHELTSPDKAMKYGSHMVVHRSQNVKSLIDALRTERMAPSIIFKVVNVATGNTVNVEESVTPQQCQDHLRKRRDNKIRNECLAIIDQFANKKLTDSDFYFAIELDENRTMRSVFWVNGRARSSYLQFGDVIVFDMTYKTNKLCLPFAPFTSVNHHRKSILFGCALLSNEEEETFVWLFTEWLKCMHGQPPISIITDQYIAMGNAIKRVFPGICHRYCLWYIGKHAVEHLPHLRLHGEDFATYYNRGQYNSTVEQAEHHWTELKEKFGVDENGNNWLSTMYQKRHQWILAYLKDVFWAGMQSTQHSESINSFFDSYVNAQTRLHEFISAYDRAITHRRAAELDEDFQTLNTNLVMCISHPIEVRQATCILGTYSKCFRMR